MITPITKCLFPAAGYGTRFLPASKSVPKEMLPVVNKPLIHYGVEEAVQAGMHEICIVYGRNKEALINYFDINYELEHRLQGKSAEKLLDPIRGIMESCEFTYTRQRHMRGLGDAILTGRGLVGEHPFAVLLADDLCLHSSCRPLAQLQQVYQQLGTSLVLVQEVAVDQTSNYGIVRVDDSNAAVMQVTSLIEKPAPGEVDSTLAIIGRYILTPDIFAILEHTGADAKGEVQITDALKVQAGQGKLHAVRLEGQRFDCGQVKGMVEATNYVYTNMHSN